VHASRAGMNSRLQAGAEGMLLSWMESWRVVPWLNPSARPFPNTMNS
jgi:hypothetical protein